MIPVSSREREKDKYSITVVFFVCFIFFSMLAKLCKLKKKKNWQRKNCKFSLKGSKTQSLFQFIYIVNIDVLPLSWFFSFFGFVLGS